MSRRREHDHADEARTRDHGTAALPLFDVAAQIQCPAPAAPGSTTSQLAADALSGPFRRASLRAIMLTLGALDLGACLSRAELSARTGIPQHVLCARISELRPYWVEAVDAACVSAVKASLRVDGYRLTPAGRARLERARRSA